MIKKTYTVIEAQRALEHYCSYQERSHKEVEQKLQSIGMIPLACEQIIGHLIQNNFLNEERYAKSFARGKFNINKWGKIKIQLTLLKKGVSNANIKIGLTEIADEDYLKTLRDLIAKYQLKNMENNPYKRKQKLFKYLQQKGFETAVIYTCLMGEDR